MTTKALVLTGIIVGMSTIYAQAHHAFARFDPDREVTLEGTVREFQWTSPHAWIMLTVDRKGRPQEWAIEMNGLSRLVARGVAAEDAHPRDERYYDGPPPTR